MKISSEKLKNLLVKTQSGQELGVVSSFDIDVETQTILCYYINSNNLIKRILKLEQDLIINSSQVISISEKEMIVSDLFIKELNVSKSKIAEFKKVLGAGTLSSKN